MTEEIIQDINNLIKKYFNQQNQKFEAGKTRISMASPPYGYEEVIEAVESLLTSWVTMGEKVKKFENEFARYIGVKHALMVNSGSSANLVALAILTNPNLKNRFNPGDEVITPALTWATTVYPIINNRLNPVFVDVEIGSYNIDVDKIEEAITDKTKVIMPVHILGNPANVIKIKKIADKQNLIVIEDACEAHGAEYNGKKIGSFGDMSTFSFYVSHHITTMEGGMLLTNNDEYYELGKALRAFGWVRDLEKKSQYIKNNPDIDPRFLFVNLGFNLRPTDLQGAFGIHQIKKIENFIKIRRENAEFWNKSLSKFSKYLQLPKEDTKTRHVYFGYAVLVKDNSPFTRKQLANYMVSKNIEVRPIMSGNIVEHPSSKLYEYRICGSLKNSAKIMRDGFFIPNHQDIGERESKYVFECISDFIENQRWKT